MCFRSLPTILVVLAEVLYLCQAVMAEDAFPRLLVLFSNDRLLPANIEIDEGFRKSLQTKAPRAMLFSEFLDAVRFPSNEVRDKQMEDYLRARYTEHPPDILVAIGPQALNFFMARKESLFPGIPLVFGAVTADEKWLSSPPPGVAGLSSRLEMGLTLKAIMKLRPRFNEVIIISGASLFDRRQEAFARKELEPLEKHIKLSWWSGLSLQELEQKLPTLRHGTALLCLSYFQEPDGTFVLSSLDAVKQIAFASPVPVFGISDTYLGNGIVGGRVVLFGKTGYDLGSLVARVLKGETPEQIGVSAADDSRHVYDARKLREWNIDRKTLPENSDIRFETPSLWESHRSLFISIIAIGISQSALIMALLIFRARGKRTEQELDDRLRFERLISALSTKFISTPVDVVNQEVRGALEKVRQASQLDHCAIFKYRLSTDSFEIIHHAENADVATKESDLHRHSFAWFFEEIRQMRTVACSNLVRDLPAEAVLEREFAIKRGTQSLLVIPLQEGRDLIEGVIYETTGARTSWSEDRVSRLSLIGKMLLSSLSTSRAELELRQSEERFSKAFRASPSAIAIIRVTDAGIVDVNNSWEEQFEYRREEVIGLKPVDIGLYADDGDRLQLRQLLDGDGSLRNYELVLRSRHGKELTTSLSIETIAINHEPCFIVIMHDITERKRADELRQNIFHASRLALVGELTASVAHEINQPLGAILSNAEAAEILMENDLPPLDEIKQILADIRKDDLRASEVIRRIRALLRKREMQMSAVAVNRIIEDVFRFVSIDARRRAIRLENALTPGLRPVLADPVHLQQVLINLIINGMDAMQATPVALRNLTVCSGSDASGNVHVSVRDAGHGIPADKLSRLFESFFTTKPHGTGLGLSIARSIIEAHRGSISGRNNPDHGATFSFTLPALQHADLPP